MKLRADPLSMSDPFRLDVECIQCAIITTTDVEVRILTKDGYTIVTPPAGSRLMFSVSESDSRA